MAQPNTHVAPPSLTYMTPIACPNCTASAHLVRRSPAITREGKGERRTFQCAECSQLTEMFIRD